MEKLYFTIAGTNQHYGQEFFEPKMTVKLVKEPDNVLGTVLYVLPKGVLCAINEPPQENAYNEQSTN
ncbi:MAG: hypothetical protein PHP50_08215 [Lachnospiraceae bacterium]|nr:hypothetical protein [Lachnospiraceae bacterium]